MLTRGRIVSAILLLGAVSVVVVSCNKPKDVPVGAADSGKQITLTKGQTLVVTLKSNITTGYSWAVLDLPAAVLEQVGKAEYKTASGGSAPVVGAGGTETFRFAAKSAGKGTLRLGYLRPWESDVSPIESFVLEVEVR